MEESLIKGLLGQGPAWVLVGIVILSSWRAIAWGKPWAERLFEAHLQFMKSVDDKTAEIRNDVKELRSDLTAHFKGSK